MIGKFAAPSMDGRFVIRKPTYALTIMNDRNGSILAFRFERPPSHGKLVIADPSCRIEQIAALSDEDFSQLDDFSQRRLPPEERAYVFWAMAG